MKVILDFDEVNENTITEILGVKQRLGLLYDISVRIPQKEYDKFPKIMDIKPTKLYGYPLEIK